jgi:hypothetical protein
MPAPFLVKPLVPATTEDTVAVLAVDTVTVGEPEATDSVSVLPATVKSAPLNTRPPIVIGPTRVAVPVLPVK